MPTPLEAVMADDNLPALVQALPSELYNEIFELTFTVNKREINTIHHPPALLHVTRATRQSFAKSYYGQGSIFYVPKELLNKFICSLPNAHSSIITEIRVRENPTLRDLLGRLMDIMLATDDTSLTARTRRYILKVRADFPDGKVKWMNLAVVGSPMAFGR